jgi:MFS family permease
MSWHLGLFYFVTFGGFVFFANYLPQLLGDWFPADRQDAGLQAAIFTMGATLARPVGGWLAGSDGRREGADLGVRFRRADATGAGLGGRQRQPRQGDGAAQIFTWRLLPLRAPSAAKIPSAGRPVDVVMSIASHSERKRARSPFRGTSLRPSST